DILQDAPRLPPVANRIAGKVEPAPGKRDQFLSCLDLRRPAALNGLGGFIELASVFARCVRWGFSVLYPVIVRDQAQAVANGASGFLSGPLKQRADHLRGGGGEVGIPKHVMLDRRQRLVLELVLFG